MIYTNIDAKELIGKTIVSIGLNKDEPDELHIHTNDGHYMFYH